MWRDNSVTAIGAMRLSTDKARDDERSLVTLHAAFDAGVTLVDTADAYAQDAFDTGHNERLIARAVDTWAGDRHRITVVTKGGLTRPDGQWRPDGRARSLRAACDASREALRQSPLPLYQLHAPDPRVPWKTSVRALASLLEAGTIAAAGLCNVTLAQIEEARAVLPIATVQVELSPWKDRALASGVVDYCRRHDITLLAYRPFGGSAGVRRLASDPVVGEIAAAQGASAFAVVLAWMRGLAPHIVPLPGPTRPQTAKDCGDSATLRLSDAEQMTLDRHFVSGRIRTAAITSRPRSAPDPSSRQDIVMVMGLPGAGKSDLARRMVGDGYARLNRDEAGGSLSSLIPRLDRLLDADVDRIVLDNTYLSRASRAAVLDAANARGRHVRGIWLDTSIDDAQVNIVWRMLDRHGRLLTSDELRAGRVPDQLSPSALFRAQREVEPPGEDEGFASLEQVPFTRRYDPAFEERAVIVWCDGVLRQTRSAAGGAASLDDATFAARRSRLSQLQDEGWRLVAMSWEPRIAEGTATPADIEGELAQLRDRYELKIDFVYCPHGGGPPACWCRKPLPGLGVLMVRHHRLDVRQCIYVGGGAQDASFARRLGFRFQTVDEFFSQ
jgi:aryl-alcohol dehydrogenase-like predicted oxidoreductase/histidinol phosphatase-like enzyme